MVILNATYKMYKIKRFSKLREKRIKLMSVISPRKNWGKSIKIFEGSMMHKEVKGYEFHKYNLVWMDPDDSNKAISNFELKEKFNKDILEDLRFLEDNRTTMYNRAVLCIEDLKNGIYVFEDNVNKIRKSISKNDRLYYGWKTNTHYIAEESDNNSLVYSKDIDYDLRLTYKVYKPRKINGKWTSIIVLSRCDNHKIGDKTRGKLKNTIGNSSTRIGDAKFLSDTND